MRINRPPGICLHACVPQTTDSLPRFQAVNIRPDGSELTAKVFVDAGYEGDFMARAGVHDAVGRKSMAEFGE